jgi:hypothetical protein
MSEMATEVMDPICGYAIAARMMAVMGPPGTNTAVLRVALSDMHVEASREVLVTDFTVGDFVEVAKTIIAPPDAKQDLASLLSVSV